MSYQADLFQLGVDPEITTALSESAYSYFQTYDPYIEGTPNYQNSQPMINPMQNYMSVADSTAWESWPEYSDPAYQAAPQQNDWFTSAAHDQDFSYQLFSDSEESTNMDSERVCTIERLQTELEYRISQVEHRTSQFEDRISQFESRISQFEDRISQVEETTRNFQIDLEEQKTRLCDEVDITIEKLREWAAQVKIFIEGAADSANTK